MFFRSYWIYFLIFGYCISSIAVHNRIWFFFYEFKRNIVLKLGLLYLLIHHYISLCFSLFEENVALEIGYTLSFDTPLHFLVAFQKKCWLLHLHLWLGQSEEKISIVLTFLVVKFNCLKTSCVLTFLTYRFYFLLNLTIFFFTYFFWNVFFDLIWQPWSL